jgi:nitroimidazol reductase NimA-like FMN-containing flavoprotein (pyridoxamine 5'-phosphate oxidase superfamily)/RimJ/RimL family protein N-acetyltransferase
VRRTDKEITDRCAIDTIIRGSEVCHLALALDNQPYLVPMSFGYDGQAIYLHSAQEGRKIDFFEGNDQVCFEFEQVGKVQRPEGKVCGWTVPFLSVIGYGTIQEVVEPQQKVRGLNQMILHYGGQAGEPDEATLARTRVWKIVVHSLTGKRSAQKSTSHTPAGPKIEPRHRELEDGRVLLIREAAAEDARDVLDYVHAVCAESDFLAFGPGEFGLGEAEEVHHLREFRASDHRLFLLGLIDDHIVSKLTFSAGHRLRMRHAGEFGLSVRKAHWGQGIGSLMLDALLYWASHSGIVTKVNLRVRTDNERAIRLYEGKGFVREGTIGKAIVVGGEYFDHLVMGLEV